LISADGVGSIAQSATSTAKDLSAESWKLGIYIRIYVCDGLLFRRVVMIARKIVRWGNSMAVRLPKVILRDVGLQEGDALVIGARNGAIVAKPVKKKPALKDLLAKISPENVHEEVDWGKRKGREAW
jgi:antitoxin MazE